MDHPLRPLMQQKEFAEFIWADWMRGRDELPSAQVAAAPKKFFGTALKLAKSPAAASLPGYVGERA